MRIVCDMFLKKHVATWNPDAFLKMYNLRFLEVFWIRNYVPTHLPGDLRILDWIGYPSKSLPSSFQSDKLVRLCLQESHIEKLWIGIKVSVLLNILKQLWIGRKVIVLLSILVTLHLNLNKLDTRKLINLTSFLTFFFLLLTEF